MRRFIAIFAGLFCLGTAHATYADKIDNIVAAEMKRQHIPGASIAVVRNGKIIKASGYGLANLEHNVRVTPDTVFQSASLGKQFTAALVMRLVEDGKLKLDAPVSTYLPNTPDAWTKISVRHLLTHTSGIPGLDKSIDLHKDYSEDELLQAIARVPLQFAPGDKWSYSNLGYEVLGVLCSKVGGKFYGEQLRERFFQSIGMSARTISERDIVPHRAAGYDRVNGAFANQEWVAPSQNTTADGSLYLTARDLARWSIALEGDSVLNKSMKDASWSPAKLNDGSFTDYGFGWFIGDINGHRFIQHGGAWQGFTGYITRYLDDRLAVMVLTNRSRVLPHLIVEKIAAHYVPALAPRVTLPTAKTFATIPMFLRGSMNDWVPRDRLQKVAVDIYETEITLDAGTHMFKVGSEDWEAINFGATFDEPTTVVDKAKPVEYKGDNLSLEISQRAAYVFRVDVTKPKSPVVTVKRKAR